MSGAAAVAAVANLHRPLRLHVDVGDVLRVPALPSTGLHQPELEVLDEVGGQLGARLARGPGPGALPALVTAQGVHKLRLRGEISSLVHANNIKENNPSYASPLSPPPS